MKKNLYIHLNETITLLVQILDKNGLPIDLNEHIVEFSTSYENSMNAIENLTINDGISVIDNNLAIVEIKLSALISKGYRSRQHMYQLTTTDQNGELSVCLTGRLFIDPIIVT